MTVKIYKAIFVRDNKYMYAPYPRKKKKKIKAALIKLANIYEKRGVITASGYANVK